MSEADGGAALFPGFRVVDVDTPGTRIRVRVGGSGPPLLLLHGYPQTHVMWHRVTARLRDRFTLVCADLRGYGDSGKPPSADDHAPYSKRAMAGDMAALMTELGHERFLLAGHDRGGRVSHRLALDRSERVLKLAVLDIGPTREMYCGTTEAFAWAYWHWFFLIQPAPYPETLLGANGEFYLRSMMGGRHAGLGAFAPEALAEYVRCARDPATVHGWCEDYRAAATIDLRHDDEDGGRKVACPLLALWGGARGRAPLLRRARAVAGAGGGCARTGAAGRALPRGAAAGRGCGGAGGVLCVKENSSSRGARGANPGLLSG